jgi:hypothetical protein
LYVPAADRTSDTIVVFDRSQADHPRDLPKFDRYSAADRETIYKVGALRQWLLHTPVRPTISDSVISWNVSSGDRVRVTMLLPRRRTVTPIDQSQLWSSGNPPAQQRKWHVRVTPESEEPWETFLNVIDVAAPEAITTAQLVTSAEDGIQGTLVRRQGNMDLVALFNAAPGGPSNLADYDPGLANLLRQARLRRAGFTVQWISSSPSTEVFVADLDSTKNWQYRVNSGPSMPIALSEGGIARLIVQGARSHTLVIF